jgi:hypothetical protein
MSVNGDHVGVSMGIDLNPFSQAITKAKAEMKQFAEHSSEHMDRAVMSGRMLHRVLNQIGEVSPGLGLALAGAFSLPMLGVELLMMGLEKLKEHFAENKKAAEEYRNAIAEVIKVQNEAFIESKTGGGSAAEFAVAQEIKEAEKKMDTMRKRMAEAQQATEKAKANVAAGAVGIDNPMLRSIAVAQLSHELEMAISREAELKKKLDEEIADQIARKNYLRENAEFEKKAQDEAEKTLENKKKQVEVEKQLDELDKQRHRNLEKLIETQAKAGRDAIDLQAKMAERQMAPFRPSMSELAGARGANGDLARRIQNVERFGKQANMAGRTDLVEAAKRELFGYDYDPDSSRASGGVAQLDINGNSMAMAHRAGLMDQLRSSGVMAPDTEGKQMADKLTQLLQLASGIGIKINVNE